MKQLFFIIFVVSCNISYSQKGIQNKELDSLFYTVMDSIWLNQKDWNDFQLNKQNNKYKNPIYDIKNIEDAKMFDFAIIPYMKLDSTAINYTFKMNILEYLKYDSTYFLCIVKFENQITCFYNVMFVDNKWIGLPDISIPTHPIEIAYNLLTSKKQNQYLFSIKYLEGFWFCKEEKFYVYSFYKKKIMNPKKYLKSMFSESDIRNYASGRYQGLQD